jgi:SAM-dependent methyltransferase
MTAQITHHRRHFYPRAKPERQPSPWWYYGRALYVSRRDYFKIYLALLFVMGIPWVLLGWLCQWRYWLDAAFLMGSVSLIYLAYSLLGMYRMYGHPAKGYLRRLLSEAGVQGQVTVADLHIGTYRHSYVLADELPQATIHSVDCWNVEGPPPEAAIQDVRDLELPPVHHPRIQPARADKFLLPLADETCDTVVLGFGTHEVPKGEPRDTLFREAQRVLKPGGKVLMFEHGNDFHNSIIFGPVIGHVTTREDWQRTFQTYFGDIHYARTSHAVDLFWATKGAALGTVTRPAPVETRWQGFRRFLKVVSCASAVPFLLAVLLAGAEAALYWILLGIAVLGVTWPWIMIGFAIAGEKVSSALPRTRKARDVSLEESHIIAA